MKAAVVKINYELIDEIIREAFAVGLMPETDRALYYNKFKRRKRRLVRFRRNRIRRNNSGNKRF